MKITRLSITVFAILATILLLLANISTWLNRTVYNRDVFVKTSTAIMSNSQTSEIVAKQISTELYSKTPILKSIAEQPTENLIVGILQSDFFTRVYKKFSTELHTAMMSSPSKAIAIDISALKSTFATVAQIVDPKALDEVKVKIPNEIVLFEQNEIPSIIESTYWLILIGPIAGITALIIFAAFLIIGYPKKTKETLLIFGSSLLIGSLIFLYMITAIEPYLFSSINESLVRDLLHQVFAVFTASLSEQSSVLVISSIIMIISAFLFQYIFDRRHSKKAK